MRTVNIPPWWTLGILFRPGNEALLNGRKSLYVKARVLAEVNDTEASILPRRMNVLVPLLGLSLHTNNPLMSRITLIT